MAPFAPGQLSTFRGSRKALIAIIKAMNSLKKKEEAAPAAPPADIQLLTEIRDALKNR